MKIDKDETITIEQHSDSPAARVHASGESVIVLSDSDSEETEVRSKLGRKSAESTSREAAVSDQKEEEGKGKGRSLFYLTRVRGIGPQYNRSNVAIGIKGMQMEVISLIILVIVIIIICVLRYPQLLRRRIGGLSSGM